MGSSQPGIPRLGSLAAALDYNCCWANVHAGPAIVHALCIYFSPEFLIFFFDGYRVYCLLTALDYIWTPGLPLWPTSNHFVTLFFLEPLPFLVLCLAPDYNPIAPLRGTWSTRWSMLGTGGLSHLQGLFPCFLPPVLLSSPLGLSLPWWPCLSSSGWGPGC